MTVLALTYRLIFAAHTPSDKAAFAIVGQELNSWCVVASLFSTFLPVVDVHIGLLVTAFVIA
jgi:hypothetical protein